MTRPIVLDIGTVRIDAAGQPEDAARIETRLREALRILADRLAGSALARDPRAMGLALEQLQIDDLSAEDWLGERGAERVAEALFDRITNSGGQG